MAKSEHKFYYFLGAFIAVFMIYLWVAPKLIKKPAGSPPRNGSNEQTQQVARTMAGAVPEPLGVPGTSPSSVPQSPSIPLPQQPPASMGSYLSPNTPSINAGPAVDFSHVGVGSLAGAYRGRANQARISLAYN